MNSYTLEELLVSATVASITVTDLEGNSIVLLSNSVAKNYLLQTYGDRKLVTPYSLDNITEDVLWNNHWSNWISLHQEGFNRMYQTMYDYTYDPTENVFEHREESTTYSGKETLTKSGSESHSISNSSSTSKKGKESTERTYTNYETTHQVAAYNTPATLQDAESDTISGKYKDETVYGVAGESTPSRIDSTSGSSSDTLTYGSQAIPRADTKSFGTGADERKDSFESDRHGNVGTVPSSDLVEKELELRKKSLGKMVLDMFVDYATIFC